MPNSVHLRRVLATKPEKVYRAFLERMHWPSGCPPNGYACAVHQLEAKVGGSYRISFRNFTTRQSHSFSGKYVELIQINGYAILTDSMTQNLTGEIQVTLTFKPVSMGTELNIVQDGLPDVIPLEACYLGWQDSLQNLARLAEPDIHE